MRIGERVIRHPITFYRFPPRYDLAKPMDGTVIYIHPEERYHTVEFQINGKRVRESFSKYDLVPGDTYYDPEACYHANFDFEESNK